MAATSYELAVKSLKTQLSQYSHQSVLQSALQYLGRHGNDQAMLVQGMPWVIMFLLKMSMLGASGVKELSARDFDRLANEVFKLQNRAAQLGEGSIELKLRQMVLAQRWYQTSSLGSLREILFLGLMFDREDGYYDELFEATYGLSIWSYTLITMFVFVRLEAQEVSGVVKMPITELVYYLCPAIPFRQVLAYIRLVSCEARHLPGFMEQHDLKSEVESEYFQETPFKYVPFILQEDGLVAFNAKFTVIALSQLAPAVFKRDKPQYKDTFGLDFESRVGSVLKELNSDSLLDESNLAVLLKQHGGDGKLIDYVVREGNDVTLVECKAADPTDVMKCTSDPQVLKRGLNKHHIYSIHQGQYVVDRLSRISEFEGARFRQLTITYGDFFIFGGEFISRNIDVGLESEIETQYGCLPLSLDRVCFLSLPDFAALVNGLKRGGITLASFLDDACEAQKQPQTRRFTLGQVVEEKLQGPGYYAASLGDQIELQHKALEDLLVENREFWRGKTEHFLKMTNIFLKSLHT